MAGLALVGKSVAPLLRLDAPFGKAFLCAGARISLVTQTQGCVARTQFRPSSFSTKEPLLLQWRRGESLSARECGGILGSRLRLKSPPCRGKVQMATDNAHVRRDKPAWSKE